MRLRNKPWAKPLIQENPQYVVTDPATLRGNWQSRFEKEQPLYIEIGMGKGRFIVEMAKKYPERNFIGLEMQTVATGIALKKQLEAKLPNLQLVCANGSGLTEFFEPNEVSGIYLNFSDPWPKDRHAKRRLPSRQFLGRYDEILEKDGRVEFKTDNRKLFEFALGELEPAGWRLEEKTFDLHGDERLMQGNVMTEYEERFSSAGNPICKYIISR